MLGDRWIYDRVPTKRFPNYTRGNAGEVLADPVSPIGWTFCCEPGMVRGCVDGFEQMGIFDAFEYDAEFPETFGLFGGYYYNSLTQSRLFGVRSGAGWETVDNTFFDPASQDIPAYVEEDWHQSPRHTEKLAVTIGWVLSTPNVPEIDRQKVEVKALRDSRPDFATLTDEQIIARARTMQRHLRATFSQVVWAALGSSIGTGILPTLIPDDPTAISKLITGIGDVDSTDIANQIFQLSRQVRASEELESAFDAGLDELLDRIRASHSAEAQQFADSVSDFMYVHGSRGPNEYDPYSWSYESRPALLLQAVDKARRASDAADPAATVAAGAAERQRLIDHYSSLFADDAESLGTFHAAVNSLAVFMAARERCKSNHIRVVGEVREAFLEVGRRATAAGHLAHERQIFMLLADEIDRWVADPASFVDVLAEREQDYLSLYELEPPYIIDGQAPPLHEWKRKNSEAVESVQVGDVLTGVAGSPGVVTGTARVMNSLEDADKLDPDDILIAESTDPSWTPLFLAAGGVVTNIGAAATHSVIVSRELGIPCVPSIANATRRIPDGATITLDGGRGTVTIDALP
jgi:phosphoenolpyruvate synthase/pyruvate phosphate dikinase